MSVKQHIYTRKSKYRVLADGAIYDQELNKTVGFIYDRDEIEHGFRLTGKRVDSFVKKYLSQ